MTALDLLTLRLALFYARAWPILEHGRPCYLNWHIFHTYARIGARLLFGDLRNVAIAVPPGSSKNTFFNIVLPVFSWTIDPSLCWILGSYDDGLETRDGRKRETLLQSDWFQERWPDLQIKAPYGALDLSNTRGGNFFGCSVGQSATGRHGDFLVANDPHKASDFYSPAALAKASTWWGETMASRQKDPLTCRRIAIHQRGSDADLIGSLASTEGGGGYEFVTLRARYEASEVATCHDLRSTEGERLWPRLPEAELVRLEKTLGPVAFAAQYQQRPAPAGGNIIQTSWLQEFDILPPAFEQMCMAVDPSGASTKATADKCSIQVWGRIEGRFYLCDSWMERASYMDQLNAIRTMAAKWPACTIRLIETKAAGESLVQELRKDGLAWVSIDPRENKAQRLAACSPVFASKAVYFPSKRAGVTFDVDEIKHQITAFPTARHDDGVDTAVMCLTRLQDVQSDWHTNMARIRAQGFGGFNTLRGFNRW